MIGSFIQLNLDSRYAKLFPLGYVICENGCWEWVGSHQRGGYGVLSVAGRLTPAHRYVYELHRGPIPLGLQIDHLCRKRDCVNPWHLEAVTQRENLLRGVGFVAIQAARTRCPRGHPLSGSNLSQHSLRKYGKRKCRACSNRSKRQRQAGPPRTGEL